MAALDQKALQNELKKKRICRFCLSLDPLSLTNIFFRDTHIKSSAPLSIQVMAIASIEIFSDDGMPSYACSDCISMFEYSYQFKQMCKKADNLLRQYPLVGIWPKSLEKPTMPQALLTVSMFKQDSRTVQERVQQSKQYVIQESLILPKKILNVDGEDKDNTNFNVTNSKLCVTKSEKVDDEWSITYLEKIDNNDELSTDDIQQLVASEDVTEQPSIEIINKDVSCKNENPLSLPKIKKRKNGNTEIVAEILNLNEEEPDPKNAEPIETNIFPCPYCERTFPLVQLRDLHLKNHIRDRNVQCDECDKSFFSKHDLQRHLLVHTDEKPFKCSACDKTFSRSTLLSRHEKTHLDVPKYMCVHCERTFISKEDMERHSERHNINRPFQCKICNKSFVFKQGLERHEIVHSRQQPFPCQYCDQSFSTTTKLTRHLRFHAGLRPYPCKICKKSFLLSHHLTRHMRSHKNSNDNMNAVDFICSTCKISFNSRDELIQHSKTHANEQNLACPLCNETFDNMNTLTTHIQDHSEGEAYACEFCDMIFMTAEKLQLHTDLDHTQEMEVYHADDRAQADMKEESTKEEVDEFSNDINGVNSKLKRKIENEQETSPKIINQVIIQSGTNEAKNDEVENTILLIPLKQRKIDVVTPQATTVHQNSKQKPTLNKAEKETTPSPSSIKATENQCSLKTNQKNKVQKIRVTKAEAAAMAREGRIKMKDGKLVFNKIEK